MPDPIYKTKDGQQVTKTQLLNSGYSEDRIAKGLSNGILTQVGDTDSPSQSFKTKDGQTVTHDQLVQSGYSEDRINKGIQNGILSTAIQEKKNPSPSSTIVSPSQGNSGDTILFDSNQKAYQNVNGVKSFLPQEGNDMVGVKPKEPYKGFFGIDVSATPKEFNQQFEDLTGFRNFDLSEPVKPKSGSLRELVGSDFQKKREESSDDKKHKVYTQEAAKIDELANKVHGGVLSLDGSDIVKAAENPYSQNVVKNIVSEYKPEVAGDLTNPENAAEASFAINAKNRINSVNAQSAQLAQYDADIQGSWGVLKNDNPPAGVDNFTKETVELKKSIPVPNLNDNASISSAITQLQELQNREKIRYMGAPLAAAKSQKETEALLDKLRNRINLNTKDTSENISWLNDKINQAVVGQIVMDNREEPEKDDVRVQQFKLGLSAIEYSDPVLFKNVTEGIAKKSKIAETDYSAISRVGQDIYNRNVFKGAALSSDLLGKETNFDYTTFEEKKAKAAGDIGEWMKAKGVKNTAQFSEKSIMQAAKELGIDKNIAQRLALEEALPAYDAIPKSGALDDLVQGMQQPISGLLSTVKGFGETPAETYLRSKQLGGTGMAQKVPTSDGFGTTLNTEKDNFWTNAIQGMGQFLTQVALAKGAGVFGKGGAEMLKLGAKGSEIATIYGGTAIPIYLQTYGQSYEQFLQQNGDPAKSALMAHIASVLETSSEMWLPDVKIADMAAKGFRKEAVDGLFSLINKGGDPADIAIKSQSIINKFLKETTNIGVQEVGEEVYSQIGGYISQMVLDPNSALKRDLNDEVWQTIKQTAISMALPSILGGGGSAMQRDFSVKTLHSSAINFNTTKEGLEKQRDKGTITQDELDSAIKLLATHKQSIESTPTINADGKELNSKQKLDYALESTKVKVYDDKISESKDAVQKEMWEAKRKEAQEVQRGILMPKATDEKTDAPAGEQESVTGAQEGVTQPVESSTEITQNENTEAGAKANENAETETEIRVATTEAGTTNETDAIVSKTTEETTGTGVAEKPLTAKEKIARLKQKKAETLKEPKVSEVEKLQPEEQTFEAKVRAVYPTLKEASDADVNNFVKENATDTPTKFIEDFGQDKFDEVVKDIPTKELEGKLNTILESNPDSKDVEVLDKIISDREATGVGTKEAEDVSSNSNEGVNSTKQNNQNDNSKNTKELPNDRRKPAKESNTDISITPDVSEKSKRETNKDGTQIKNESNGNGEENSNKHIGDTKTEGHSAGLDELSGVNSIKTFLSDLPKEQIEQIKDNEKHNLAGSTDFDRVAQEIFLRKKGLTNDNLFIESKRPSQLQTQKGRIKFQNEFSKWINDNKPEILSELYIKSKKDGSNPELVKAVEDLINKNEPNRNPTTEVSPTIPTNEGTAQEQGNKEAVQPGTESTGRTNAEGTAAVLKPVRQLGTGANVYFESGKYRVNDGKDGKIYANIGENSDNPFPATTAEFDNVNEAVYVAEKFAKLYPKGVPEALLVDKVVEDFKQEYKNKNQANNLKIREDETENKFANDQLTEQDNPVQEPGVKVIEGKAKSTNKTQLRQVVSEVDKKVDAATGVTIMNPKDLSTDEARFQGREGLDAEHVNRIAANYKFADQDPIHVWKDKDGKTYVLSGHHRLAAALQSGQKRIKVQDRTKDFTEKQAIRFAKEEANLNRTNQTDLENAALLRQMREDGRKEDAKKFLERQGKNKTFIEDVSRLNPKGKVIEALRSLQSSDDKVTQREIERIAQWVGAARKLDSRLTNAHENEMFDFLVSGTRYKNKQDFLKTIAAKLGFDFNSAEPLNLRRFKSDAENKFDEIKNDFENKISQKQDQIDNIKNRFRDTKRKDYIPTTAKDYAEVKKVADNKIADLNAELKVIQKSLETHLKEKGKFSSEGSLDLFSQKEFKEGEINTDNGAMPVDEYIAKAKAVLSKLFPKASFEAYESTADYLDAGGHFGSRGVSKTLKDGSRRILLNVERLREVGDGRTAFHEVIHPIVDEVLGESREELDPLWLDIFNAMKDVKGFDAVSTHIVNYPESAQSEEGITELLANIADGKISIEDLPPAKKNAIIELLNKLFEKLGLSVRFGDDYDFKSFANDIKTALQTGEMDTLKSVVDDRAAKNERARKNAAKIDRLLFGENQMKESNPNFQQVETASEELKAWTDIVQTYIEENQGLSLKEVQDKVAQEWGDRSQDDLVKEAYNEATKNIKITGKEPEAGKQRPSFRKEGEATEKVANELSNQFTKRLNNFVDKLFGVSDNPQGHVVTLKGSDALDKAAAKIEETGIAYQITMPDGTTQQVKPINADVVNGFYSPLEKTINETKFDKLPAKQWIDKFAKGEEAKWTGLTDWLKEQKESVSKADIQQFLKDNRIQIAEVVKQDKKFDFSDEKLKEFNQLIEDNDRLGFDTMNEAREAIRSDGNWSNNFDVSDKRLIELGNEYKEAVGGYQKGTTKFGDYQLLGEKDNYKEVLVTMPDVNRQNKLKEKLQSDYDKAKDAVSEAAKPLDAKTKEIFGTRFYADLSHNEKMEVQFAFYKKGDEYKNYEKAVKEMNDAKLGLQNNNKQFQSSHFDEPNILVHLRMNERVDSEGNKILFLEEVQSDFAQSGRKNGFLPPQEIQKEFDNLIKERDAIVSGRKGEYSEKEKARLSAIQDKFDELHKQYPNSLSGRITAVPPAPFVTNTNKWVELGFKVALKEAVKQGAAKIAWANGEQQNDRYSLRKQVDAINWTKVGDDKFDFTATKNGSQLIGDTNISSNKLAEYIGKGATDKILENSQTKKYGTLEGVDLEVGGKGMKGFYGSPQEGKLGIVGNVAKSLFKQEPKEVKISTGKSKVNVIFEDGKSFGFNTKEEAKDYADKQGSPYKIEENNSTQHSIDITPQLKAQVSEGLPLFMYNRKGEILGFTDPNTGDIYLNGEKLNPNTPIHEAGHLWLDWAGKNNAPLLEEGLRKIRNEARYLSKVTGKEFYQTEALKQGKKGSDAYNRYMEKEALAQAIGDSGAQFFMETKRNSFKAWANKLWEAVGKYFGIKNKTPEEIRKMTLGEFTKHIAADILDPNSTFEKKVEAKKAEAEKEAKVTPVDLANVDSTVNTAGVTHTHMQDLADEYGFDDYVKQPETIAELDAEAAKVLARDGEEAIKKIFRKITETRDGANSLENRMILQYVSSLRAKFYKNPMDKTVLSALDQVRKMVDISNSRKGKDLQSLKGERRVVDTLDNWMLDKMESLAVDELPDEVKKDIVKKFDKFQEESDNSQKVTDEYEAEKDNLAAELAIEEAKKQRSIIRRKSSESLKKERTSILSDIREKLAKARNSRNVTIVPYANELVAIAPDITKLVKNLVESGIVEFEAVVDNVHDLLKDEISQITRKDVTALIGGRYSRQAKTKGEIETRVAELKKEAKLLDELERLQNGGEPKDINRSIKRNQRIKELEGAIKDFDAGASVSSTKARYDAEIEQLEEDLKNKNYVAKKKLPRDMDSLMQKTNPELWKRTMDARIKRDELKQQWEFEKQQDELARRNWLQKSAGFLAKLVGTSQAIKAGIDDSVTFIQLGAVMVANPRLGIKSKIEAIRDISNQRYKRQLAQLHASPYWDLMEKSGLSITEPHSMHKERMEEMFRQNLLDKDFKIAGKGYNLWTNTGGIFERLFTSMSNNMRVGLFMGRIELLLDQKKTFETHPQEFKDAASAVNNLTARAKINKNADSDLVRVAIWAPQMLASSLNLLGISDIAFAAVGKKGYYGKLDPAQRKFALSQMGRAIGLGVLVMAAAAARGWEPDKDPTSSTFGTILIGQTRYSIFGRFTTIVKAIMQIALSKRTTDKGVQDLDSGKFGSTTGGTILGRFFRGKMTPAAGLVYDYKFNAKKNFFTYEPISLDKVPDILVTPMAVENITNGLKQDGAWSLLTRALPSIEGINIYDKRDWKKFDKPQSINTNRSRSRTERAGRKTERNSR